MKRINIGEVVVPAQPPRARPGIGRGARFLSATLLCVAALSASDLAYAAHGGGGGGGAEVEVAASTPAVSAAFTPAGSVDFMAEHPAGSTPEHLAGSTPAMSAAFMAEHRAAFTPAGFPVADFTSYRRARGWINLMPASFAADRATAP